MNLAIIVILGYLIGSVPFALVIGMVFYKTDIRRHGSGNLGGGNTGRVLGRKAGLAVMTLDILKVSAVVGLSKWIWANEWSAAIGALAAAVGHCCPVFAGFKGGKAVATMYGFLFGLIVFEGWSVLAFLLPLFVFLGVLYLWKIIALSSMVSAAAVTLYAFLWVKSLPEALALTVFTVLIVIRHRANIRRMIQGNENKITWM